MKLINLTQGKQTIVDDEMFDYLNQWKWHLGKGGYAYRRIYLSDGKCGFISVYMHRLINNTPDNFQTDHINRNKLDNRKVNLRTVTSSQNRMNKDLRRDNKSKHVGVWFEKSRMMWVAELMVNNKKVFMKRFKSIKDAIKSREEAEEEYFGEYKPFF